MQGAPCRFPPRGDPQPQHMEIFTVALCESEFEVVAARVIPLWVSLTSKVACRYFAPVECAGEDVLSSGPQRRQELL